VGEMLLIFVCSSLPANVSLLGSHQTQTNGGLIIFSNQHFHKENATEGLFFQV
jgi:hypothetical protein